MYRIKLTPNAKRFSSQVKLQHHQKRVQAPTRPAATLPAIAKPPEIALLIQSERHYLSLAVVGNQDLSTEAVVHHQLDVASHSQAYLRPELEMKQEVKQ